jgi:Mn-dependent DtxR family transcriptional regulator
MNMRKSANWMTIWDDRILEVIREEGSGSPTPLSEHDYIHISASQVSKRLKKLSEYGLLESLGNGVYVITPEGERYLDGELAVDDINDQPSNGDEGAQV